MKYKLSKFSLLCEEVLKDLTIPVDAHQYKFQLYDDESIKCAFEATNGESQLVTINITIPKNTHEKVIEISNGNNIEKITQKKFMMQFYDEYQKFKAALKEFEDEVKSQKQTEETDTANSQIQHTDVPAIDSFNKKVDKQNLYTKIKQNDITFTFIPVKNQKIKDIVKCVFSFTNTNPKLDNSPTFDTNVLIKLDEPNAAITRIELEGASSEQPHILTATDFEKDFANIYKNLLAAITKYNKAYFQK